MPAPAEPMTNMEPTLGVMAMYEPDRVMAAGKHGPKPMPTNTKPVHNTLTECAPYHLKIG